MRWLLLLLLAIAACGKDRAQTCGPDVYDLQQYLKKMDRGLAWLDTGSLDLIRRDELPKKYVPMSPVVQVRPTGLALHGMPVEPYDLISQLQAQAYMRQRGYKTDQVVIVVDAKAPWERVVSATQAAERAGIRRVLFAFAGPPASDPPPRTRIDDDLDKLDKEPGEKAVAFARMLERVTESCPTLFKTFRGYGMSNATDDRDGRLIDVMAQALVECECKLDLGALRSLMYRLLATKPITLLDVTLDRYDQGSRIELPAETPWRDASKRLAKDGRMWLAVPGEAPEEPAKPDAEGDDDDSE
jgi:hypothetical protein